jgi:hypothetical protein
MYLDFDTASRSYSCLEPDSISPQQKTKRRAMYTLKGNAVNCGADKTSLLQRALTLAATRPLRSFELSHSPLRNFPRSFKEKNFAPNFQLKRNGLSNAIASKPQ